MEKYLKIHTSDGFEIKGILNWKQKTEKLIIFVHGLTGSMNEAHYYTAKEFFISKGYDVYRFNLYTGGKTTRNLHTSSIKNHGEDIGTVLKYFENKYSNISLVGHSLAGPSIIESTYFPTNMNKIIYWDPAFDTSQTAQKAEQKSNMIFYGQLSSGKNIQISQKMYDEFGINNWLKKLPQITSKQYIIFAGENNKIDFKNQTDDMGIESCIIEGANHGFTQEGKYEELFEKTLEFIEK